MIFLVFKWIAIMLINLLGFLTAPIIFPIAYYLRKIKFIRNIIVIKTFQNYKIAFKFIVHKNFYINRN